VVAVSNLDPGSIDSVRAAKNGVGLKEMRAALVLVLALTACVGTPKPEVLKGPVVGYTTRSWRDPVTGRPLRSVVFFPPLRPLVQTPTRMGPWWVEAGSSEAIAFGLHPLVVISHGEEGSRFGHHDLAVALARAGFVALTFEHPGDNYADATGVGTQRVLLGRAWQVSGAIDALMEDPLFAPHIDASRIGVAGFSAGGYTSLLLLGAKPDFTRWAGYCARHPEDLALCKDKHEEVTLDADKPTKDDRVKAAFVMAPLGIFFGQEAFWGVRRPVSLAVAEKDTVLLPAENAEVVRAGLSTIVEFTQVPGADHYVFLAPCGGEAKLCADPPGVLRAAVHDSLNTAAVKFFAAQLK